MAASYHSLSGGDLFSEAVEALDFQASEMARPLGFEPKTLCLEGADRPIIPKEYASFLGKSILSEP